MSWLIVFPIVEWLIRVGMVVVILRRRFPPVTALAWLALTFLLPELGLIVYLLVGVSYLGRRRVRTHRRVLATTRGRGGDGTTARPHRPSVDPAHRNMFLQAQRISGNPIVTGNDVELIAANSDLVERLVADIDAAADHVHLVYYIFWADAVGKRVGEALKRAASRGVQCRLLADSSGSRPLFHSTLLTEMIAAGVELHAALPVAPWRRKLSRIDLRNHRKISVIDGRVAYAGSHNIVDAGYGHKRAGQWVDLSVRLTGPVVAQLQQVFLEDWFFETGERPASPNLFPELEETGSAAAQAVPTGPNHEGETFRRVLVTALNVAHKKIVMTTPYLVPDEPTQLALAMAADRGVEVIIIVPERSDHPIVSAAGRWYFKELIEAGVQIHHYCDGMLHAKTITVDDAFALVGSANIDVRSFHLNFEINVLLYGPDITRTLMAAQQQYLTLCRPVRLDEWLRRPWPLKYIESAAALLSPLL